MNLFNRKVEVLVYTASDVFTIKDLRIDFSIDTHIDPEPNEAFVDIYNLSPKTRGIFAEHATGIEVYAGWAPKEEPEVELLFKGSIVDTRQWKPQKAQETVQGPDLVTTIHGGDGMTELVNSYLSKTFAKGTLVQDAIRDIAGEFGLPVEIDFKDSALKFLRARSYNGKVGKMLSKIVNSYGLQWSFQQGVVEIININEPPLGDLTVPLITAETGMIGRPILIERDSTKPKKDKDKIDYGVEVQSLIDYRLRPYRLFELQSKNEDLNGVYRCDKVRHEGSSHTNDFKTIVEADIKE